MRRKSIWPTGLIAVGALLVAAAFAGSPGVAVAFAFYLIPIAVVGVILADLGRIATSVENIERLLRDRQAGAPPPAVRHTTLDS
ncbi:MAG: hypothetical protein LC792_20565 [Actinobacteria bacterium]|nr:hypothetical protein [Actinomycetota bacterium]